MSCALRKVQTDVVISTIHVSATAHTPAPHRFEKPFERGRIGGVRFQARLIRIRGFLRFGQQPVKKARAQHGRNCIFRMLRVRQVDNSTGRVNGGESLEGRTPTPNGNDNAVSFCWRNEGQLGATAILSER